MKLKIIRHVPSALFVTAVLAAAGTPGADIDTYRALMSKVYYYGGPEQSEEQSLRLRSDTKAMAEATTRLHDLVTQTALRSLTAAGASSQSVTKAVDDLQGAFALRLGYRDVSNLPIADIRTVRGFHTLMLAFSILRGGYGIPENASFVQFYSDGRGKWELIAEENATFDGCAFSVSAPIPGTPDETLYLAWGTTIGDTGARQKVRAYSFDGEKVRTTYSRDNLVRGQLSLDGAKVILEYEESANPKNWSGSPRRVRETLESGSGGIHEQSRESIE